MSKFEPSEIVNYFFIDIILIFLMINYNMPLATIYVAMAIVGSLMYYVAADQRIFQMIPFWGRGTNKIVAIAIGVGFGVGFIFFYNWLGTLTPMANVFATTAFGESESMGKIVFGFLIPLVETRFFFRTILQWYAWRVGLTSRDLFTFDSVKVIGIFAALFTIFHATSKGITNNIDLIATFAFGAMSIGMVIYFQRVIEAAVAHVVVNSHSIGIFDNIMNGTLLANPLVIVGGIALLWYFTSKGKMPFFT